jgi:diguanylate cyclase (GGDEF)-like protein
MAAAPRGEISREALESRVRQAAMDMAVPITLLVGVLYVPVALSHFVILPPPARWPMFAAAFACATALLLCHRWLRDNRDHLAAVPRVVALIYVTIIAHSLLRLTYARGPGDMLFVGVLAVAMALLPAELAYHTLAMASYLGGWAAIVVLNDGAAAFTPYAGTLAMTLAVSVLIRHLDITRTRRVHELLMLDAKREAEVAVHQARLHHELNHDALTGMPNRRYFAARLGDAFERARADDAEGFALLHLDLDNFQLVNDSLGHEFGDQLLQAVALRLLRAARAGDTVARLGADEFAVICPGVTGEERALAAAASYQEVFATPFAVGELAVQPAASVGIAIFTASYADAEAMLRDAGIAMAEAKHTSVGQQVFAADMHTRARDRLDLEVGLRGAIERDELCIHYQPIVALATGEVVGHEALVRWEHPERGLLKPHAFLALAEETGLIHPIGRWVLERACRDIASWGGGLFVSVNVAPKQFAHVDFEETVAAALAGAELEPGRLWLELVETAIIDQPDLAEARIRRLHALGVSVVIDDFGVGYSSLGYLARYPFRVIKLDRSFVERGHKNELVIEAIIALAHALSMRVVAEGVEEPEQLEALVRLGCELGQGHLLCRPTTADKAAARRRVDISQPREFEAS